jgi:hypothetical protein
MNTLRKRDCAGDDFIFNGQKEPDKPITAFYVHDNLERFIRSGVCSLLFGEDE